MRFSLIDRITQLQAGEEITAVKNLSLAEEYLQDHFPGFPVEPGVLMLESMVQASAWLMRYTEDFRFSVVMLKQAKAVKFNSFLRPGQTLTVTARVHQRGDDQWVLKTAGTVDGESTVSGRLILQQFNLASRNPEMQSTDEQLVSSLKGLLNQLWVPESSVPA